MKKLQLPLLILCCLLMVLFIGCSKAPETKQSGKMDANMTKVVDAMVRETYENVLNKYKIAYYFWYDTYADGEIPTANIIEADKKIKDAEKELAKTSFDNAKKLLKDADSLLSVKIKSPDQFPYETSTPLLNPDLSKVKKAKASDYGVLDRYGVLMNDIGPSIWGYGDDGEYYFIMTFFNYHATGNIIIPVVVEIMSTKDPNKRYLYLIKKDTKVTKTDNSIDYYVEESGKMFHMLVTDDPVGGGTTVLVEGKYPPYPGKAPAISFSVTTTPTFSYWYNQNVGAAMMYPEIVLAGFEQPGPASGNITIADKKITFNKTAGAVTEVCMISGAPGNKNYKEYREAMSKYGNEWYIAIHTNQIDAMFISYGKFRDAGIYYKGKYIVPAEYKLIPGIANQTLTIIAKTKEYGDLVLNFEMKLHDPVYTERVATVTGSYDGQVLTNGGSWFEHCFKGSPDGIKAVQETPELVDPL